MYGRQSEIKRIQSSLQRIGKTNPHRSPLDEVSHEGRKEQVDTVLNSGHEQVLSSSVSADMDRRTGFNPKVNEVEPFMSTSDRYNTPAGQQALQEMGKIVDLPAPLPAAVTFSPQLSSPRFPWPSQINVVDNEASQNIHQLAHSLRQHRYTHLSNAYEIDHPDTVESNSSHENAQIAWNTESDHPQWPRDGRPGNSESWIPNSRFTLTQGLVWLIGAIVIRMMIDRLLEAFPSLWIVMAAMVLTPVAIALYQTAVNPQSTVHSGRRLLVIMIGLLIGGQL